MFKCGYCEKEYQGRHLKPSRPGRVRFLSLCGKLFHGSECRSCREDREKYGLKISLKKKAAESLLKTKEKTCAVCGAVERISHAENKKYEGGRRSAWVLKNEKGEAWRGNHCPECCRTYIRNKLGFAKRDLSKNPITMDAVWSERVAEEKFKLLFDDVRRCNQWGPDLVCRTGDLEWSVEVKRVTRKRGGCWQAHMISPKRLNDDLVALVMPNGAVHIDTMRYHLSKCHRGGSRTVTELVKKLSPTEYAIARAVVPTKI